MRRGEVWWAEVPPPQASEPGYRRPVLIVQANAFNRSRIGTVVVAVITTNMRLAAAPGNVKLGRRQAGLPKASAVNVSQVLTLDRAFLTGRAGALPAPKMDEVDAGLRLVLALN